MINIYSFLSDNEMNVRYGREEKYIVYEEDDYSESLIFENANYDEVLYLLLEEIKNNINVFENIEDYENKLYNYSSFHLLNVKIGDKLYTVEAKE